SGIPSQGKGRQPAQGRTQALESDWSSVAPPLAYPAWSNALHGVFLQYAGGSSFSQDPSVGGALGGAFWLRGAVHRGQRNTRRLARRPGRPRARSGVSNLLRRSRRIEFAHSTSSGGISMTGRPARRNTSSACDPSKRRETPPRPWVAMQMASAPTRAAA